MRPTSRRCCSQSTFFVPFNKYLGDDVPMYYLKFAFIISVATHVLFSNVAYSYSMHNCSTDDPSIVYCNDFEDDPLGVYSWNNYVNDWGKHWGQGVLEGNITILEDSQGRAGQFMRVRLQKGKRHGIQWKANLDRQYNDLYYSYSVKFDDNFDLTKKLKMLGLEGGAVQTVGGNSNGETGWLAVHHLWSETPGKAFSYIYHNNQDSWGSAYFWMKNGDSCDFVPQKNAYPWIKNGKWHHIEGRVKMNTPGKSDGVVQAWVDNNLVLDASKCNKVQFRNSGKYFGIDRLRFYFIRNPEAVDKDRTSYAYLDDIIYSTKRIILPSDKASATAPTKPRGVRLQLSP